MKRIYLFTGDNSYAMRRERQRWSKEFIAKHGQENLTTLDGARLSVRDLLDQIAVLPFLAEKRIVFVEGLPRFRKEEAQMVRDGIHPQVVLVFLENTAKGKASGKKGPAPKEVAKIVDETKEFPALKGRFLSQWIQEYAASGGSAMAPDAVALLLEMIGEDQEMLASEIDKLALYQPGRITSQDIEELAIPSSEGVVWKITDLLCAGGKKQALSYAHRYLRRGGEPHALWAVLLGFVRNLAAVWAALQAGVSDSSSVAAASGVNPFALRSLLPYAKKISARHVAALVDRAVRDDIGLKTGAHRSTDGEPEELEALIDRLMLSA